jgi:uncharacterized protein (TIGR01777 family)
MQVFVTGGTGLVGRRLVPRLLERGDQVMVLTRRPAAAEGLLGPKPTLVEGDPMQAGPWMDRVGDCDGVIHLAGENIFARRWSAAFKELLRDSRLRGTRNVVEALSRRPAQPDGRPRVLVSASAIGYYGTHGDEELDEDSPPGSDFLAQLCVDWEKAALAAQQAGIRCALVRVGLVLDRVGGALGKMLLPFQIGVGGPIGNGRQWASWIHHADLVGLFLLALDRPEATGPLNGTAPTPLTNRDFSRALGHALHRPAFLPAPRFGLRLMLGEVADVIASGQRVLPRRPLALGYTFRYPLLEAALAEIFP